MSKFNKTKTPVSKQKPETINKAGGVAFDKSAELELVSRLLTWFVNDGYYESEADDRAAIRMLISKLQDKKFAAKAAIYARTVFGMRSVTHLLTGELFLSGISGEPWARNFVKNLVTRVDDMMEILAYWDSLGQKGRPRALLRGISDSFQKFDTYQLGKYQSGGSDMSLIDVVRLTHPAPTEKNKKGLEKLVAGNLKATGTRQAALVKATQNLKSEEEREAARKEVWKDQLESGKIGYFELVKNMGGVLRDAPEYLDKAIELLGNEKAILNSKVFPFRYVTAVNNIKKLYPTEPGLRKVLAAMSRAVDISCKNVPKLENTLVAVDVSGSMDSALIASKQDMKRHEIRGTEATTMKQAASLFGAILVKAGYGDLMIFASDSKYIDYNPEDSALSIANSASQHSGYQGHGTCFGSIFRRANRKYDRVVIFSDMQGWQGSYFADFNSYMDNGAPIKSLDAYKKKYNADPKIYSVNMAESGGSMFNLSSSKVVPLAGFSEKLFNLMEIAEQDRNALINAINAVDL